MLFDLGISNAQNIIEYQVEVVEKEFLLFNDFKPKQYETDSLLWVFSRSKYHDD